MIGRLTIRPLAIRDIDAHASYLAQHASEAVASRFLEMLASLMLRILETPELGPRWESDAPALQGVRFRNPRKFRNHLVFYRLTDDCIEIVRVLHGSRDLEKHLLESDD
jgi:toxin ParE1/3/4